MEKILIKVPFFQFFYSDSTRIFGCFGKVSQPISDGRKFLGVHQRTVWYILFIIPTLSYFPVQLSLGPEYHEPLYPLIDDFITILVGVGILDESKTKIMKLLCYICEGILFRLIRLLFNFFFSILDAFSLVACTYYF